MSKKAGKVLDVKKLAKERAANRRRIARMRADEIKFLRSLGFKSQQSVITALRKGAVMLCDTAGKVIQPKKRKPVEKVKQAGLL